MLRLYNVPLCLVLLSKIFTLFILTFYSSVFLSVYVELFSHSLISNIWLYSSYLILILLSDFLLLFWSSKNWSPNSLLISKIPLSIGTFLQVSSHTTHNQATTFLLHYMKNSHQTFFSTRQSFLPSFSSLSIYKIIFLEYFYFPLS